MALDWLFQGQPPPSVTSSTISESSLPAWYQDYIRQLVMRSSEIAAQPYQPYTGQRIAPFTPMQQEAHEMARGVASNWLPYMQGAQGYVGQAADMFGMAPQYFQQGAGMMGQGAGLVGQGAGMMQQGAGPAYAGISNYMNPYQSQVLSQIGEQASRNLTENILPNINTTFTGGGTFGGSRHGDFTNRAIRDTQKAVADAVGQGLYSGWTQAGQFSAADQNRMLQAGQGMGQLGGQMGNLGQGFAGIGGQFGNLGLGYNTLGGQMANLAGLRQRGDIAGMGAIAGAGGEQQQLGQRSLDLAYQDFLNQTQWPFMQAGFMSDIIRGISPSMGRLNTQTQSMPQYSGYGPSPLQQFMTYAGLFGGLGNLL